MIAVIFLLPDAPRLLLTASLFFPIYYTILSLVLWQRRDRRPQGPPGEGALL